MRPAACFALIAFLSAGPARAQEPESAPARDTATAARKAPVGPAGAFLRSFLVPGWGQLQLHRPVPALVFIAIEGTFAGLSLKANHDVQQARLTDQSPDSAVVSAKKRSRRGLAGTPRVQSPDGGPGGVRVVASLGLPGGSQVAPRREVLAPAPRSPSGSDEPAPIGIFDSGIGGLTVARALYERLPGESTVYFGDTARVPYGPKSPDTVRRYSLEILDWLLAQQVKAVVIACNTSTAHALEALPRRSRRCR